MVDRAQNSHLSGTKGIGGAAKEGRVRLATASESIWNSRMLIGSRQPQASPPSILFCSLCFCFPFSWGRTIGDKYLLPSQLSSSTPSVVVVVFFFLNVPRDMAPQVCRARILESENKVRTQVACSYVLDEQMPR